MSSGTSAMNRLKTSLTTGNLWLHILSLLLRKKRIYAYALGAEMKAHSGFEHGFLMNYLVLYKLEKEGLISSEFEGRRKYYSITANGRREISEAKKYLKNISSSL